MADDDAAAKSQTDIKLELLQPYDAVRQGLDVLYIYEFLSISGSHQDIAEASVYSCVLYSPAFIVDYRYPQPKSNPYKSTV